MLFPAPSSVPAPAPRRLLLGGSVRRPSAQVVSVLALATAYGHISRDWPFTIWNPVFLLLLPFAIGILSNKGFGRPAMGLALLAASSAAWLANAILFGWAG